MDDFIEITPSGFRRPPVVEAIRTQARRSSKRLHRHGLDESFYLDPEKTDLLLVKTAAQWMKQEYGKPMPRMLLGDLWMEGELCVLFADTNLGKSILAVQIGNNLAQGVCTGDLNNQLPPQTHVLYVDFEMGSKQFESRYYHPRWGSYPFGKTFYRAEFNPAANNPALYDDYDTYLENALESAITQSKARVLIIDNLTYMATGTERAREALPLMKKLKAIKTRHKLSMLVLAHTPKRDAAKAITVNDLQGSKMIINFCDSAFAIGKSYTRAGALYLKQIKQRSTTARYGADNVCLCQITRDLNDLHFTFTGHAHERNHLQRPDAQNRDHLKQQARELRSQGHSFRHISKTTGIALSTLARWIGEE